MGVGKVVGVLGFLLSPMGLVVAAIIGLVAAFAAAMVKSESFRNTVITAVNNVKDIAVGIFAELSDKMNAVWEKAQPVKLVLHRVCLAYYQVWGKKWVVFLMW